MKKLFLSFLFAFGVVLTASAQAPQAIPYQAVARDVNSNVIANQNISLRFTIHDSITTGTIAYQEKQSVTTNALGLFSVNIGQGTVVSGTFAGINWGKNNKFTQVEMDVTGGTNYVTMGTSQILSVPYALYSGGSGDFSTLTSSVTPNFSCIGTTDTIATGGSPECVAVSGNYAYVVGYGSNDLRIYDVSNPASPVWKNTGGTTTGSNPATVVVSGNYAYVVDYGSNDLRVYDVSNPALPVWENTGGTSTGSSPVFIAVSGNYAYVADYGGNDLRVYDISNPVTPVWKNTGGTSTGSGPVSVVVSGNYAYVVDFSGNDLRVYDISNPVTPVWKNTGGTSTSSEPNAVVVSGNYAYVVDFNTGDLRVYDISNPVSPVWKNTGSTSTGLGPGSVAVSGNYAYVVDYTSNDLRVYDISNPVTPVWKNTGGTSTGSGPSSVVVSGNYAYVVDAGSNDLRVINLVCNSTLSINTLNDAVTVVPNTWTTLGNNIYNSNSGSVGIGTASYDSSAIFDVSSTTKGFLMPRMTTAQRNAITSPAVGLQIFNTSDQCVDIYNGSNWTETCGSIIAGTATSPDYWPSKAGFGGTARAQAVGFSIGTKGYIGTGNDGSYRNDFWEWDQVANTWTQKANFGGMARVAAVGFSIGTEGYIGTGYSGSGFLNDFWQWDRASNTWTQKANLPGTARAQAVGFSIGTKGYIGTGYANTDLNDFWEWDQASNTWTQKANLGGTVRHQAVGFSIGAKGYIGTGAYGGYLNDFWEWDQTTNTWTQKANFPGTAREQAVGFSIGTEGYIGTGYNSSFILTNDFWQWDQASNTWTQKASFSGTARANAVGFSIGTKGYTGTGQDANGYKNDFWEYDPAVANAPVYAAPTAYGGAVSVNDGLWTQSGNTVYASNNACNVGIGTATPQDKVDIFAPGTYSNTEFQNEPFEISSGGTSSDYTLYMGADRVNTVSYIQSVHVSCCMATLALNARGGNVGIGLINPGGQFELSQDQGRKPSTSTWTITSDARLKNMEGAYTKGLKEILQLRPITYHYKNFGERKFPDEVLKNLNVGFSAQEVQKVFPEAVGTDADGYLNFNMHSILVAYVNAIKEQQKEIEELKTDKNTIQAALEKIEKENASLKADMQKIKAQLGMDVKAVK